MNKYSGGNFDDFLKEEGIFEEVSERTRKRMISMKIEKCVKDVIRKKTDFAGKINEDLVLLNHHLFDLENTVITSELLNHFFIEATELLTNPVQINDPLFEFKELLSRFLTEETAA